MRKKIAFAFLVTLVLTSGCVRVRVSRTERSQEPPARLMGEWVDDYEMRYQVGPGEWRQGAHGVLRVIKWNVREQYLIARNDGSNQSDPGKFTRVDWMELDMAPYSWAYCYSAYNAETAAAAEAVTIADRSNPRTGCNGHPFSRMKRP